MVEIKEEDFLEFKNKILNRKVQTERQLDSISGEESTKTKIVNPILRILGYDTANIDDVDDEFPADLFPDQGVNKKVDYAIKKDGDVVMLLEAKPHTNDLQKPTAELKQLYEYNNKISTSQFGILTNGIKWMFYEEIEQNQLSTDSFFVFNLLKYTDSDIKRFFQFSKKYFEVKSISDDARKNKMSTLFKERMLFLLNNPEDMTALFKSEYNKCGIKKITDSSQGDIIKCIQDSLDSVILDKVRARQEKIENAIDSQEKSNDGLYRQEEIESLEIIKNIALSHLSKDYTDIVKRISLRNRDEKGDKGRSDIVFDKNQYRPIVKMDYRRSPVFIAFGGDKRYSAVDIVLNQDKDNPEFTSPQDLYKYSNKIVELIKGYLS